MVRFSYSRLNLCLCLIKLGPNYATDLRLKARHSEQRSYSFAPRAQKGRARCGREGEVSFNQRC